MNPSHPLVREHIRAGCRAIVLEQGMNGHMIAIYDKGSHIPLLWTHLIPATLEGRAIHNVQNAMFAAAMAYSMGKTLEDIRHGLRTFDSTYFQAPGRMNVFDEHPFKVILDYGHNPAAVEAMCRLVQRLDVKGRRLVVISVPGDRRDADIDEIGRIAAGVFDRYIIKRDDDPRGRGPEEVPIKLRAALLANGVPADRVSIIIDEHKAVDAALETARPGDLLLVFGDNIARCWKQIIYFKKDAAKADAVAAPPAFEAVTISELPSVDGTLLVRDERGVRMAREPETAD
jgi:cyanophycin synthetase